MIGLMVIDELSTLTNLDSGHTFYLTGRRQVLYIKLMGLLRENGTCSWTGIVYQMTSLMRYFTMLGFMFNERLPTVVY